MHATAVASIPHWVKLARIGHRVAGYVSQDGRAWSLVGSTITTMSTALAMGLVVTSHDVRRLNTSTFEQLSLEAASAPGFYAAVTNHHVYPKPALPALGPAGFHFSDPTFGSPMLRVTDKQTRPGLPGRSFTAPSAAHQLSALDTCASGSERVYTYSRRPPSASRTCTPARALSAGCRFSACRSCRRAYHSAVTGSAEALAGAEVLGNSRRRP